MIIAAAILYQDDVYDLNAPSRHADIYCYYKIPFCKEAECGFIDENGVFYDRRAAMQEAIRCSQKLIDLEDEDPCTRELLYTENLW